MTATTLELLPGAVVQVLGRDRVDLLHRLSTNDLRPLHKAPGVISTLFTSAQGKLLDWTDVLSHADRVLLRTSPGRAAAVADWVEKYTIMEDVQSSNASHAYAFVALTGADAVALTGLPSMPARGQVVELNGAFWYAGLSAYGSRMEGLVPAAAVPAKIAAWQAAGAILLGDAARELQRLRAGVPSHAYEFAAEVNPLELRLTQYAVGWNKGCYIGQEVISRLDSYDKVARLLMGLGGRCECDGSAAGQSQTDTGRPASGPRDLLDRPTGRRHRGPGHRQARGGAARGGSTRDRRQSGGGAFGASTLLRRTGGRLAPASLLLRRCLKSVSKAARSTR